MPHRRMSRSRCGGTIINIVSALVFVGLLIGGVVWVMKTAGEAGTHYSTAIINNKS